MGMLVISRRIGEVIYIGDGPDRIEVMLVDIDKNKVRIGINANRKVPIFRSELLEKPCPEPTTKSSASSASTS